MNKIEKGRLGEELAVKYLLEKGFAILERNIVFHKLELDIIAEKNNVLFVIEVKSNFTKDWVTPIVRIDKQKIKHLYRAAFEYMKNQDRWVDFELLGLAVSVNLESKKACIETFTIGLN